ncbi:hypothetical protein GA0116948_101373 [Chitinophaga costaii]|uniref:Uncharacterized protein n=1 Tax=Chitinophaga costaii TaxID=1335309 RepID=A0A1C3ZFK2_9BACT|nr:hypothetical protein [Chitinophaga costaii]SCB81098.1 hypothetical protein GA0116948_101373 [Chitinophaga costaii]
MLNDEQGTERTAQITIREQDKKQMTWEMLLQQPKGIYDTMYLRLSKLK